jgi:hypothetical protein
LARLIFVEGFPGAGKSTTAQFLARQLTRHGRLARWVYEEEVPNPFVPAPPPGGYRTWEQFADMRVERWRVFAAAASDYDVTVIPESALLQLPVFTMLRRNNDPSAIAALVSRLVETAAPLRPTLVYLARRDPEAAFRAIRERRGLAWLLQHAASSDGYAFTQARGLSGVDGLLAYWRAHAELCAAIVARVDIPNLVLEVGQDSWAERRRRICDFVDAPFEDDPVGDPTDTARLTGHYSDGKREVTVEMVDGRLIVRGALWVSNALLPLTHNVFDVESWPLRVIFEGDSAGRVHALRWSGPRLSWGGPSGVFTRIAG